MTLDWRHDAACVGEDPELFFPLAESRTPRYAFEVANAKAVCARCPVTSDCLRWALDEGMDFGVWGGLDANERRALKQRLIRR